MSCAVGMPHGCWAITATTTTTEGGREKVEECGGDNRLDSPCASLMLVVAERWLAASEQASYIKGSSSCVTRGGAWT